MGQGVPKSATLGGIGAHIGTSLSVNLARSCHNGASKPSKHLVTLSLPFRYPSVAIMPPFRYHCLPFRYNFVAIPLPFVSIPLPFFLQFWTRTNLNSVNELRFESPQHGAPAAVACGASETSGKTCT